MPLSVNSDEFKLRERVKELNCLYELSRIAWKANNNIDVIIKKTLDILPEAMQHPNLAEVHIAIGKQFYHTPRFRN
ncbi:MAG TPA: hypothetical protein PKC10_08600, partial [Cyclobacteriaceae bacterium]|nr:hypothetical protein [Cyclobacteriaceae bacterium]